MDLQRLLGRVVVVAGDAPELAEIAALAMNNGAAVAVVSAVLDVGTAASVRFRADARDRDAWERVAMHVEQHLGPVDGVVTDESSCAVVDGVFAADLARRGRDAVHVVRSQEDVAAIVTHLADRPRAAPSPPPDAEPER